MADTGTCPTCGAETDPAASIGPSCDAVVAGGLAGRAAPPTSADPPAGLVVARWLAGTALVLCALYLGALWLLDALLSVQGGRAGATQVVGGLLAVLFAANLLLHRAGAGRGAAGCSRPPIVVPLARLLAALAVAVSAPVLGFVGLVVLPGGTSSTIPNMVAWGVACGLLAAHGWLLVALGRRRPAGWWALTILAGLWAVLAFPFGTLIAGPLLYWWAKQETRTWFGLRRRP